MTDVLKCNSCNIVIDEMLSYIQNKVSVIDEVTLVQICKSAFTSAEIKLSKSLLFDAIRSDLRKIIRKNKGKEERDLADIMKLFKTHPDELPVFVARQLEKLPPITFDHLDCTKLLKDLMRMQTSIEEIKSTYATLNHLNDLKDEVLHLKNDSLPPSTVYNVNAKRGAWLSDSGPVGLSYLHDVQNSKDYGSSENTPQYREIRRVEGKQIECRESCTEQRSSAAAMTSASETGSTSYVAVARTAAQTMTSPCSSPVAPARQLCPADNANDNNSNCLIKQPHLCENESGLIVNPDNEGWNKVAYRKKRPSYRYLGKSGIASDMNCNFKAADKKVPVFITNIHSETIENDIVVYIRGKTQETVSLEKITMEKEKGHKAFKFYVSESKLPIYLDEKIWPKGIIFRRFMFFKRPYSSRLLSAAGKSEVNNE